MVLVSLEGWFVLICLVLDTVVVIVVVGLVFVLALWVCMFGCFVLSVLQLHFS